MSIQAQETKGYDRSQDLAGKVALITGASRGIGRAIALQLASRGAAILGTHTGTASSEQINEKHKEVTSTYVHSDCEPPKVVYFAASLSDPDVHHKLADKIRDEFGGHIDIFINNAAATDRTYPGELEEETLHRLLLCNIQTPAMMVDTLVKRRYFKKDSRIIFISSAESVRCEASVHIYAATKAANEAMARGYANAFGGKNPDFDFMAGTTANSVLTGLTNTMGVQQLGPTVWEELRKSWVSSQAIPKLGEPDDVADVVGFLCSRESRWVTGSKISVNGGSIAVI